MNERLGFIIAFAKYSVLQPKVSLEFVKWFIKSKTNSSIRKFPYKNKDSKLEEILEKLSTTEENISIDYTIQELKPLTEHINQFLIEIKGIKYPSKNKPYLIDYSLENKSAIILYSLCKMVKPSVVVETGIAYGASSSYILYAMQHNDKGKLYSIDFVWLPWQTEHMIGAMIPSHLKNRWNPIYGKTSEKLKPLLDSLGKIDVFIHDSEHTYDNMLFEFSTAWDHIKEGGFLISDDIGANDAFHDFCLMKKIEPMVYMQNRNFESFLGIIQKPARIDNK